MRVRACERERKRDGRESKGKKELCLDELTKLIVVQSVCLMYTAGNFPKLKTFRYEENQQKRSQSGSK